MDPVAKERMQDRWLWPHLENIDRIKADRPEWFDQSATWVITEKMHGFNARFGIDLDGTPWAGTRNQVVVEGPGDSFVPDWNTSLQQGFIGFAAAHVQWLKDGETLFGEWAGKGVQKGIDYGEKDFYAFGLICDEGHLVPWGELEDACRVANIKTVPVLYQGVGLPSVEQLTEWRDGTSKIATTQREGICLTQDPPAKDGWGHYLIGKFKGAAFTEVSHAKREVSPDEAPDMTAVLDFVAKYGTPERLQHVLGQVREVLAAVTPGTPSPSDPLDTRATGDVLRTMYNDVVREAGTEYEALADTDKRMLGKVLNTATKVLLDDARTEALK
jgi:hypothetical protein